MKPFWQYSSFVPGLAINAAPARLRIVRNSVLRMDPTRTTSIRRAFMTETTRRLKELRKAVIEFLVTNDMLGLKPREQIKFNARDYQFHTDDKKLDAFNDWLQVQIDSKVLSVSGGKAGQPWTAKYIESAYKKGVLRAYTDTNKSQLQKDVDFYTKSKAQFLRDSFAQPEALAKVRLLATRSFEGMRDVTSQMKNQMNRILADGMAHGRGPAKIAKDMAERIDGISRSRAMTIARTEIINAHSEGQLDAFEDLGVDELGVMAEWSTAGDDRVCPECGDKEGKTYTVDEARGVIPLHPNCRCAWIPALPKPKKGGKRKK